MERNSSAGSARIDSVQAHLVWDIKVEELARPREEKYFKSNILKTFVYEDEIKWQLWLSVSKEKEEKSIFVVPVTHSFQEYTERELKCSVYFKRKYSEIFMKSFNKKLSKWTGIGEGFSFSSQTLQEMTNSGSLNIIVDLIIPVNINEAKCESEKKFKSDISGISSMDQFSDVTIVCQGEKFGCHKLILAARSPVFKIMLEKDMLEKNDNIINIEDSDPVTVGAMLEHIYTGTLPDKASPELDMDSLLYLSAKYNLKGLMDSFEEDLRSSKTPKSILKSLVLCFLYFPESGVYSEVLRMGQEANVKLMQEETWQEMVEFYPSLSRAILNL